MVFDPSPSPLVLTHPPWCGVNIFIQHEVESTSSFDMMSSQHVVVVNAVNSGEGDLDVRVNMTSSQHLFSTWCQFNIYTCHHVCIHKCIYMSLCMYTQVYIHVIMYVYIKVYTCHHVCIYMSHLFSTWCPINISIWCRINVWCRVHIFIFLTSSCLWMQRVVVERVTSMVESQ